MKDITVDVIITGQYIIVFNFCYSLKVLIVYPF